MKTSANYHHRMCKLFLLTLLFLSSFCGFAQQASIPTNQLASTPWINGGNFKVTQENSSSFLTGTWEVGCGAFCSENSAPRAVDASITNFATAGVALGGDATLRVKDNNTTPAVYEAGNFVGFLIKPSGVLNLGLLSSITIKTYLNGGEALETVTSSNLIALSGAVTGAYEVGFYTKQAYNQIEITFSGLLQSYEVYYAIQRAYSEGPALACNVATNLTLPNFPVVVTESSSLLAGVTNANAVVTADATDFASIAVVTGGATLAVRDQKKDYDAGLFAGFDVENSSLVNLGLLSGVTVETFLNGQFRETSASAGLLSVGLLTGGRQKVGFVTGLSFDEVRITVAAGLSITGPLRVYALVLQRYCEGDAIACNTPKALKSPAYPVLVNYARTSSGGFLCVGCTVTGAENVLTANATNPATLSLTAGVGSSASYSVKKAGTSYEGGMYVGYDVANPSLLNVGALGGVSITTYLKGTVVDVYNANALAVSAGLLQGGNRQMIGVVTKKGVSKQFDEVQISFSNILNVDLGAINIYNFVVENFCEVTLDCDTEYPIVRPNFPAVIESARTGITSVACVGCAVNNSGNLVDASLTNFATISVPLGLDLNTAASISVRTPETEYPGGSFAGFTIRNQDILVAANLLPSLKVTTYLQGVEQESSTVANLIDLTLLIPILGNGPGVYNVGFRTSDSKPFDEIRLSVTSLASVLNFIEVFAPVVKACKPVLTFNEIPAVANISTTYTTTSAVASISDDQPLSFSISEGALPAGLQLNVPTAGVISGTPTGPTGPFNFKVQARSAANTLLGEQDYTITVNGSLPVKLTSFTVKKEGQIAQLNWTTTEEVNSESFDVERSNSERQWVKIGNVKTRGESTSLVRYHFPDQNPVDGENLYRLKMIDKDGTFAYSSIQSATFTRETISLYPNPVVNSERLSVQVKEWDNVKTVKVINAVGKVVFESAGEKVADISTSQLSAGLYVVQIIRKDGQTITSKFVKL